MTLLPLSDATSQSECRNELPANKEQHKSVYREAEYDNYVGFYIADENGSIDTDNGKLAARDDGYIALTYLHFSNIWGFEDMRQGGVKDFNDIIVSVENVVSC